MVRGINSWRPKSVRLSKASYFADFAVYPPVVLALLILALRQAPSLVWIEWSIACLAGIAAWTLLEYVIHRWVLHRIRFFAAMHDLHHEDPEGFVGTPTWLSLAAICVGALFPLLWGTGFDFASGITAGLMLGYVWYGGVHHVLHHWRIRPGSHLYRWKRRHALHHYARRPCNFGVTTQFWDRVFGTAHPSR
jgi:sterol desaturase/sphingolipid hydroxylase (fatty acid hydroxylase superfamily)